MWYIKNSMGLIVGTDPTGTALLPAGSARVPDTPANAAAYVAYVASLPPPTIVPQPFAVSKLKLRRALRAAGLGGALNKFLNADPIAREDWDDAQVLRTDDPLLVAALPALAAAAGLTTEQAAGMLAACREDGL